MLSSAGFNTKLPYSKRKREVQIPEAGATKEDLHCCTPGGNVVTLKKKEVNQNKQSNIFRRRKRQSREQAKYIKSSTNR